VTASQDGTARQKGPATGRCRHDRSSTRREARARTFSPDGTSCSASASMWNSADFPGTQRRNTGGVPSSMRKVVMSAVLSPDGTRVVRGARWDGADMGRRDRERSWGVPLNHEGLVQSAVFSSRRNRLITVTSDGKVSRVERVEKEAIAGLGLGRAGRCNASRHVDAAGSTAICPLAHTKKHPPSCSYACSHYGGWRQRDAFYVWPRRGLINQRRPT